MRHLQAGGVDERHEQRLVGQHDGGAYGVVAVGNAPVVHHEVYLVKCPLGLRHVAGYRHLPQRGLCVDDVERFGHGVALGKFVNQVPPGSADFALRRRVVPPEVGQVLVAQQVEDFQFASGKIGKSHHHHHWRLALVVRGQVVHRVDGALHHHARAGEAAPRQLIVEILVDSGQCIPQAIETAAHFAARGVGLRVVVLVVMHPKSVGLFFRQSQVDAKDAANEFLEVVFEVVGAQVAQIADVGV